VSERPWMKFYPSDWRADALLRQCAPLSRYVWLEVIGLMHEAEPYGHLVFAGKAMTTAQLARAIAMDKSEVEEALAELEQMGVSSRTRAGVIYSRRMVRDEQKHLKFSKSGKLGAAIKLQNEKEKKEGLKGGPKPPPKGTLRPRAQNPEDPPVIPREKSGPKHPIPDDWEPEEFGDATQCRITVDAWSKADFEAQVEAFRAHHEREGSRFVDWQAAWKTWVLNSRRFADRDQARERPKDDFVDRVLRESELLKKAGAKR
jgi:hypothetical protein